MSDCVIRAFLAACVFGALSSSAVSEEIAVLTLKEQVGVARTNEPVRMGIPLPKGLVKRVGELALTDAGGKPIPVQFKPVAKWLADKSLRWVHAVFQVSVPAKGEVKVKLVKGKAAASGGLKIADTKAGVTIDNGVLKLVVKGLGQNLIDSASYQGTQVIDSHAGGFVATIDGKAYRPGNNSQVEVVEKGTEGVVVKISGKLVDKVGKGPFTYTCYLHVFQNSPEVRIDFTYTNVQGKKPADHVTLEDLSLLLRTTLGGGTAYLGHKNGMYTGKSGTVVAKDSDLIEFSTDGKSAGTSKGKSLKPVRVGWAGLRSGKKVLAAGVRWFWQMHPKAIEVRADGTIRVALFAKEVGKPLDVYMGQGRTHYITLMFHDPTPALSSKPALLDFFAGRQVPLRAACTPEYYCRTAQAFGPMVESKKELFPDDVWPLVQKFDNETRTSIARINKKIDGHTYGGATVDSYGYYPWGDVFHWAVNRGRTPWDIQWESNYYDYPWAALLQFARTGDLDCLDVCDRHGLHIADVFMCKWHPQARLRGACRYSPPDNHVGMGRKPYVSVEFNHHKALSILTRYLLLGDLVARDHFLVALNNATLNPEHSWRQCRGAGAKLWTLTEGYRLTKGKATMAMMKRCVADGAKRAKRGGSSFGHKRGQFMYGHATEGLIRYVWLTGDESPVQTIKVMNDWLISANKLKAATGNSAMSMAYLWRKTGDKKYRDAAVSLLQWLRTQHRPKGFGQEFRSVPYALYYLSAASSAKRGG